MSGTRTHITHSAEETQAFAKTFIKTLDVSVVTLTGNLGSGKTTFVQGIAQALGIPRRITSPTFIIMRSYKVLEHEKFTMLYHVDLYRIESTQDVEGLGLDEIFDDKQNLVVIEWPEKVWDLLPEKRVDVQFKYVDENVRKITIK